MPQKKVNDLLFIGNLSFDNITNRSGQTKRVIGGSAFNGAYCASLVSHLRIRILGIVGHDFPVSVIREPRIDTSGIRIVKQKSTSFDIKESRSLVNFKTVSLLNFELRGKEYAKHVHISCRKGINDPCSLLKRVEHTTSSIDVLHSSVREKFHEIVNCMEIIDMIFLNEQEYRMLWSLLKEKPDQAFPKVLMFITLGKDGIKITRKRAEMSVPAIGLASRIVSTVGAGDAFFGGFLGAYNSSQSIFKAVATGISMATISVQDFGVIHLKNKLGKIVELSDRFAVQNMELENKINSLLSPE